MSKPDKESYYYEKGKNEPVINFAAIGNHLAPRKLEEEYADSLNTRYFKGLHYSLSQLN